MPRRRQTITTKTETIEAGQLADLAGVSRQAIHVWIKRGRLVPSGQLLGGPGRAGRYQFDRATVVALLERLGRPVPPELAPEVQRATGT